MPRSVVSASYQVRTGEAILERYGRSAHCIEYRSPHHVTGFCLYCLVGFGAIQGAEASMDVLSLSLLVSFRCNFLP
jgi:hypothetical protein